MPGRPYLLLLVLWALYFHPLVLHPTYTLFAPYSDFLAEHLPARIFLVREWRATGELPLWNPYHFCGSPFVHDIQVGVFYPPYALTYLVPESAAGAVMSWVVALHVFAAGGFAYRYARANDLGEAGSLVAAVGWMFAGKWMTHLLLAGHTITIGLAWLPLVLLGLERGARTGGVGPALGTGAALALMILGTHPQWTFYAGVLAVFWTLPSDRAALRRWLLTGAGAAAVALALTAVQLLPTLEAAGQSSRAGGVAATGSLGLALDSVLGLAVPSPTLRVPESWELYGAMGPVWLAAALAAAAPRRRLVFLGLVFFAAGGAVLVEWLPGFNLFRVPSRMLLIAGFPLALLAGTTTDALARTAWADPCRRVARLWLVPLGLVVLPIAYATLSRYAEWVRRDPPENLWLPGLVGWAAVVGTTPAAFWLLRPAGRRPRVRLTAWLAVLLVDRLAPTVLFPAAYPFEAIEPEQPALGFLADRLPPGTGRVLDTGDGRDGDGFLLLGVGAPRAMLDAAETVRGYNPLDVHHYREYLAFAAGVSEPLEANGPFTQQVIPALPFPNKPLLDAANLRYVTTLPGGRVPVGTEWVADWSAPPPPGWEPVWKRTDAFIAPEIYGRTDEQEERWRPQVVYENTRAFPRAWVVPEAKAMPAGGEYDVLLKTDFRRTVLLATDRPLPPPAAAVPAAHVAEYRPNRVRVDLTGDGGGWLVLADVWYPGWVCRVDGAEVPVERANHAFRAVALPPGAKEAVFAFEPRSYRVGWWVSAGSVVGVVGCGAVGFWRRRMTKAQ